VPRDAAWPSPAAGPDPPSGPGKLVAVLMGIILWGCACSGTGARPAPPTPTPEPRVSLGEPNLTPRAGAPGAPVDCAVDVANRSGRTLARLILACELLDGDGVPVGTGLGALQNVPNGDSRAVRTVVYGVRSFASARAVVTSADFQ
jgi:hypothetical protein